MVPDNRKYAIVDYSSVTEDMIDEVLQGLVSCRRSVNGDDRLLSHGMETNPDSTG